MSWIKIHRRLCDHELWTAEQFTKGQAWIDLLLNCNYKDGVVLCHGVAVEVKRGEIAWSRLTMGRRWKWSRGKVNRYLLTLEKMGQLAVRDMGQLTTVLSVCNYEQYQETPATDGTTGGTRSGAQYKKEEGESKAFSPNTHPFEEIISDLNAKAGTKYRASGAKTRALIRTRIEEGFTVDDFRAVHETMARNWVGTSFERFLRPETLYGTKFESYLNSPPDHKPATVDPRKLSKETNSARANAERRSKYFNNQNQNGEKDGDEVSRALLTDGSGDLHRSRSAGNSTWRGDHR